MTTIHPMTDTAAPRPAAMPLPAASTPAVCFQNVSKSYGRLAALDNISLTIGRGQVVALVGPNGAGKTTLIDILMGLRKCDSGRVTALGCDVSRERGYLARVGVQLQETGYYPDLCARDYIRLFSGLYRDCMDEADLIASFGLGAFAHQAIGKLSGGQRQRVGLALALLHTPELVILDEPTVGLDPIMRSNFWDMVRSTQRDAGNTVLFSTHYMDEAQAMASSVLVIAGGRIVAAGSVEDIVAAAGERATTLEQAYQILVSRAARGEA